MDVCASGWIPTMPRAAVGGKVRPLPCFAKKTEMCVSSSGVRVEDTVRKHETEEFVLKLTEALVFRQLKRVQQPTGIDFLPTR